MISIAALVMAGGRSTRMRANGHTQHKALRTVSGVALCERSLGSLLRIGVRRIYASVSAHEPELRHWIHSHGERFCSQHGASLEVIVESTPLGTIGAVGMLPHAISHVLVVNVDNLTTLDLRAMIAFHMDRNAVLTVACHEESFSVPYGEVVAESERILAYMEKPTFKRLVSSGVYVLAREAMDRVASVGRCDAPDLVKTLIARRRLVAAYRHSAAWVDVNDEDGLKRAERIMASPQWSGQVREKAAHA